MPYQESSTDNKAQETTLQIRPQVPPPPEGASMEMRTAERSIVASF